MSGDSFGETIPTPDTLGTELGSSETIFSAFPIVDEVASRLTPRRLALIMDLARQGDLSAYLTLAKNVEDRDSFYAALLQKRKLSVTELDSKVKPPAETTGQTDEIVAEVKRLTEDPLFNDLLMSSMDAVNTSFAVSEIVWDTSELPWRPVKYVELDQRYFMLDRQTHTKLRFIDGSADGEPLFPFKYVCHSPKYRFGPVWRSGLIRPAAALYMAKQLTTKDWMRFIELFGMPLRVATYDAKFTDKDKNQLRMDLRKMGTEAFALIKEGAKIELKEINRGGSNGSEDPFLRALRYVNQQYAILVEGQTLTTTEGERGTQALGAVHENVKNAIRNADARRIEATVNRDLIKPFVVLNFGDQPEFPTWHLKTQPVPNLEQVAKFLPALVQLDMQFRKSDIHEAIGIPAAPEGAKPEDVLTMQAATPNPVDAARAMGAPGEEAA